MKKLFLLLAMMFLLSPNYAVPPKTYTRAQVDSIVAVEVQQQLDQAVTVEVQKQLAAKNAEIELLVEKSSQDKLGTYITEQNNQLTRQNTFVTIILAVFGLIIPLLMNRQYEKRLDAIAKQNEKRIDTSLSQSNERLSEIAKQNEEKISEDIAKKTSGLNTQTIELNKRILALNENIKNHDESIKNSLEQQEQLKTEIEGIRKQVETLAGEAEKSKEEARKAEQAAKASELFSKAYNEKNVDKQIEFYSELLKISPKEIEAYNNIGVAYSEKGDDDKAIESFNQAIKLKPDAVLYSNRGASYINKEDYDKAIESFDQAIKLDSDFADAYYNRGIVYAYKEDTENSIKDINRAIELDPKGRNFIAGLEIVKKLQTVKNLLKENSLEEAFKTIKEAREVAMKTNDKDWVNIVDLKIKEIEKLQK